MMQPTLARHRGEGGPAAPVEHSRGGDFLVFGSPLISDDDVAAIDQVLRSGWLGKGPRVEHFERAFAARKHAEHAIAVSSCTAALHLSLIAAGVGPGDEVITTPLTFCATINAIIHAGGTPVLVDVDPHSRNINPGLIQRAITRQTRAILPVHFAGWPCEMGRILEIAAAHKLKVVEDCAHAIEGASDGKECGAFGDFGCFSFYVTKNITTGEGGMILARKPEDAARIRRLSLHGLSADAWERQHGSASPHYDLVEIGFKYNMTDLQAALGLAQLSRLDTYWERRTALWTEYGSRLRGLPVVQPAMPPPNVRHARHLYTILIDRESGGVERDKFVARLAENGIGVGIHYRSAAEHRLYRERFGWRPEDYPEAARIGRQTVSLPLSAKLTAADVERVCKAISGVFYASGGRL